MATVVRHKESRQVYVLIGTSYSFFKDSRPSFLGGALFPYEEEGVFNLAAVANKEGEIKWFATEELKVIEVDGRSMEEILSSYETEGTDRPIDESEADYCLGCDTKISVNDRECPSCGLVFIIEE